MTPEGSMLVRSACPLDCPDACTLDVEVSEGRVEAIRGNQINPVTAGFICRKVGHFGERVHGPRRILRPAERVGPKGSGEFRPIAWEKALSRVAEEMERLSLEPGGEAILPFSYGGSNGYLTQDTTDAQLFGRIGASRLARTVCAAPSGRAATGLYGKMPGVAMTDFVHARLIVLWGANPSASSIHLVPIVQRAQKEGAQLVVIDPRRTPLAKKADMHLAPLPGTDLPLALALIRWLFARGRADMGFLAQHAAEVKPLRDRAESWTLERAAAATGLKPAEIEAFAELYAEGSPAVIRCGWGVERNRNGGSAVAAILALPAVAGKFGVRGGGYTMSNSGAWRLDSRRAAATPEPATRRVNMTRLGRALLHLDDPPIGLLFVYNANPLATLPEQELVRRGLAREDLFTVVFDQVLTDTARYADLLLPATTFLEHDDLARGYGALVLNDIRPAIPAVGEARSNTRVFGYLLERLGLSQAGDAHTEAEFRQRLLAQSRRPELVRNLERAGIADPECGPNPVQFVDSFPATGDRRVHLCPRELEDEAPGGLYAFQPDPGNERHPLALISPATSRTISSTLGELYTEQVPVELNPEDAAERGIADGDEVRVFNDLGEVRCHAAHNGDLRRGVALLPKGLWSHNTLSGTTSNALVPDTLTDLGGGACFNDARVQIEKA